MCEAAGREKTLASKTENVKCKKLYNKKRGI